MQDGRNYTSLQIALHWGVAVLVVINYVISEGMGRALNDLIRSGGNPVDQAGWHVWIGTAIFLLVVLRLVVRSMVGAPEPASGRHSPLARAGRVSQGILYALLVAVPIGGIVTWFGRMPQVGDLHALAGNALIILAGIHAAAALYHHFVRKDATLRQMLGRA